jgi:Zn-finger nucleic acid-binding protein
MQCPLCIETALEARFHNNVEIDVCPKCKGVWLDRDELAKLAAPTTLRAEPSRPDADRKKGFRDDDDDDDDRKKRKKRKKSLGKRIGDALEDVLDDVFD